ncbi:TPA: hypothetical protein DF272_00665 [Candidatus Falkowbacteria bacterium]|nr:hypothetical protein [Candidatus Falkowbacteria bacterium]
MSLPGRRLEDGVFVILGTLLIVGLILLVSVVIYFTLNLLFDLAVVILDPKTMWDDSLRQNVPANPAFWYTETILIPVFSVGGAFLLVLYSPRLIERMKEIKARANESTDGSEKSPGCK